MNLPIACRICIQMCNISSMCKIFDNNIVDNIEKLVGVKLQDSDQLPDKICAPCVLKLDAALYFLGMCKRSVEHFDIRLKNKEIHEQKLKSEEQESLSKKVILHEDFSKTLDTERCSDNHTLIKRIVKRNLSTRNQDKPKSNQNKNKYKNNKPQLICDICGNIFERKQHFLLHVKRHNDEKTVECEICRKRFFTNSELNRHMRSHTGEKPFECKFCHRKFSDCSTHIKHERTHTNERPFSCTQCGKSFTCSYILKNHILIHTGERAYKCALCNKSFQRDQHLRTHYKSIMHKQNAASCEQNKFPKKDLK